MAGRPAKPLPIGILASTLNVGQSLASELAITSPVLLSPGSSSPAGGQSLGALLVEDGVWPLSPRLCRELLPALSWNRAYVYHIQRYEMGDLPKETAMMTPAEQELWTDRAILRQFVEGIAVQGTCEASPELQARAHEVLDQLNERACDESLR